MHVNIQEKPYSIEFETIADNIKHKHFEILRPIDKYFTDRIDKMKNICSWTQLDEPFSVIPEPHPHDYAVLVPLHYSNTLYEDLLQSIKMINNTLQIISIEQIKNPYLEDAYEAI